MSPVSKPKQIQHTQSALVVDDIITPRVTSLGYSGDLASEEIEELGNANIVEILDDTPTVSSTVDLNDYGSVETLAVLANLYDKPLLNTAAHDSTYWEVDATHFETSAVDLLNPVKAAAATGGANLHTAWFNNCKIQSYSATYSVDGFATESISLENSAQYVFMNSYRYSRVLRPKMFHPDGTSASTISHDGDDVAADWATSSYGMDATYHFNDLGDIYAAAGGNDSTGLYLTKDGVIQTRSYWGWDGTTLGVSSAGIGQLYWSPDTRLRLIVSDSNIETFAGPTATGRSGLRKGNTKLYFWDATDAVAVSSWAQNGPEGAGATADFFEFMPSVGNTNYSKRIQSVSIDVTWNRDLLEQLGEHEPYDRGVESTEITATLSAIGSDAELFSIAAGHGVDSTEWLNDEIQTMNLTEFQNATNLALRVDIFTTTDVTKHTVANRCKSVLLIGGKVTSFGDSVDVPGRATTDLTITFNGIRWMGDKVISGRTAV